MLLPLSTTVLFLCCFLAAYLVVVRTEARTSNGLFAAFLLLTAFEISGWYAYGFWSEHPFLNRYRLVSGFGQMPLFFGFFATACFRDRRLRRSDWPHLVPLVLAAGIATTVGAGAWDFWARSMTVALHVQYFGYAAASAFVLWSFRKRYVAEFSDAGSRTFLWLSRFLAASICAHVLVVIKSATLIAGDVPMLTSALQQVVALVALLVMSWVLLEAFIHPDSFRGIDRRLSVLQPAEAETEAPPEAPSHGSLGQVREVMDTQEPFLKPDLKLQELAVLTDLTPRELSSLLNAEAGVHFFDFVNGYRIERAKSLLLEDTEMSVTEVMMATGFNSKSSFNTAFRKFAKTTPSAFRKANFSK